MNQQEHRRKVLAAIVEREGLASAARRFGKPDRQVNDMLAGRKPFGEKVARDMERNYDPSRPPGWLDATVLPSSSGKKVLELAYSSPDETIRINKFDSGGSMGRGVVLKDQPGVIQSWNVSPEWLNKNVRQHTGAQNLVVVTGFGDSMKPMFNPGDPLLVDIGVMSVDLDAIYFFRVEGEGFIKRLQRIPGEGIRVISENKAYESWTIRKDMDFQVFGRVLKVWCSEEF